MENNEILKQKNYQINKLIKIIACYIHINKVRLFIQRDLERGHKF